mgnify:FL=1
MICWLLFHIICCSGGRTKETIVSWVKKKSGPPAVTLAAKEDVEKHLKGEVAVIGYFAVS